MFAHRVVYSRTVEGLFVRALAGRLTPPCKEAIKAAGIDVDRPLHSTYPAEVWEEALQIARRHLFPGLEHEEGMHQLGRTFVEGFWETGTGRVILAVAKVGGPARSVQPLSRRLSTGNNYMRVEVRSLSDRSVHLWLSDPGADGLEYMAGIFERSLQGMGARNLRLIGEANADGSADYRATWE